MRHSSVTGPILTSLLRLHCIIHPPPTVDQLPPEAQRGREGAEDHTVGGRGLAP